MRLSRARPFLFFPTFMDRVKSRNHYVLLDLIPAVTLSVRSSSPKFAKSLRQLQSKFLPDPKGCSSPQPSGSVRKAADLKRWIRATHGTVEGTREKWSSSNLDVQSLKTLCDLAEVDLMGMTQDLALLGSVEQHKVLKATDRYQNQNGQHYLFRRFSYSSRENNRKKVIGRQNERTGPLGCGHFRGLFCPRMSPRFGIAF